MFIIDLTINLEDIQYDYHLKIITYKLESTLISSKRLNQDKSNNSENKISDNSSFANKNLTESNNNENISNTKQSSEIKNFIKLIFILQPNTIEDTKLLTITMIDYSETLNKNQLEDIIKSIFQKFEEIIIKEVPLTKNCESIIIDANINTVFNFYASWKFSYLGEELVKDIKIDGDPYKLGSKIYFTYLQQTSVIAIVEEINSYIQEGNLDDNNEWNYKYKGIFENGETEYFNAIFVSCENGTKTYFSLENDINEKIKIDELSELSSRKLKLLNGMKSYIEKNKELLTK